MKKLLVMTVLLLAGLMLTLNGMKDIVEASDISENTESLAQNVSQLEYENNIKETKPITLTEFLNMTNKHDDFITFMGFSACSHCRNFSVTIKEFSTTHGLYYLDVGPDGSFKSSSTNQIQQFLTIFKNSGYQFMGTPTMIHVQNNKIISMAVGEDTKLSELESL